MGVFITCWEDGWDICKSLRVSKRNRVDARDRSGLLVRQVDYTKRMAKEARDRESNSSAKATIGINDEMDNKGDYIYIYI